MHFHIMLTNFGKPALSCLMETALGTKDEYNMTLALTILQ